MSWGFKCGVDVHLSEGVDQLLVDQALIAQEVLDRLINHLINRRWCRAESGGAEIGR